ncbi:tRNA guanosine(34) transglycosylase Tgt [Wolbachia endosymbiont of Brugia malayi]|uniref:tRNA guanosine(34) transglycosylase Tgt n=1 Tax=Wolbachia endosymbiont of Brugia malayi TaxID=80849 RepID=UPI00004C945D|nr:tRNA guanosine(34) transglycosylase Tgt [Wolbachia endosymbiont of Brugia malayi]AAW71181.1 Queuine/archaeosine tRNA-ribosyltransferase [Wolbachia endosymbiont strain TRS of Brugia malayi]QCB61377.1 tRNA guanosine(34) transglycosylase Tgt [Wolbachia endosymbiont of Brugia malayi]
MRGDFAFKIIKQSNSARAGTIKTPSGNIETPAFIFCATRAAIKAADIERISEAGTQIILSNTYHLMLQPGENTVAKLGGLRKMMGWNGPMLTDSGGYQIFSLGHGSVSEEIKGIRKKQKTLIKIDEDGAIFRSYINGKAYCLTPERSIQIQQKLGADLILVLDECTPFHVSKEYTRRSMLMSHKWAERSLNEFGKDDNGKQALYGISQGGVYRDLRRESCYFINNLPFFGQAIGGSLGRSKEQMYDVVSFTMEHLKKDRPTHLLGIGRIVDIFYAVEAGIDTFDCVHPTRLARHGGALIKVKNRNTISSRYKEHINLRNQQFELDGNPIEGDCLCFTCRKYSRAYIHHLLKTKELLAYTLITIHNVFFMNKLMKSIRQAILDDRLDQEKSNWVGEV